MKKIDRKTEKCSKCQEYHPIETYGRHQICSSCGNMCCRECRDGIIAADSKGPRCPHCKAVMPKNTTSLHPSIVTFRQRLVDMRTTFEMDIPSVETILHEIVNCCTTSKSETKRLLKDYATSFTDNLTGTDILLRRQVLSHFHQLIRQIHVFLKCQSVRLKKDKDEETTRNMYPFLKGGVKEEKKASSIPSSITNTTAFESDMLAACQYKLHDLKCPYASRDLNDPFVLAQVIGFCERYYLKALKPKRRELISQYTSESEWNRNFTKYLRCLNCPGNLIESSMALKVHWLLRKAESTTN